MLTSARFSLRIYSRLLVQAANSLTRLPSSSSNNATCSPNAVACCLAAYSAAAARLASISSPSGTYSSYKTVSVCSLSCVYCSSFATRLKSPASSKAPIVCRSSFRIERSARMWRRRRYRTSSAVARCCRRAVICAISTCLELARSFQPVGGSGVVSVQA